jgi:glycosyltransferase involved in cell wall biosynthesis
MRILLLTQWFDPEPTFKGLYFARALADAGHEVEVLTGFPNYPKGKVYKGYKIRPWQREVIDGITVNRVALYPGHDRSPVRRILNYSSFGFSAATIGPMLVRKPDVVYVYNLATLGFAAKALRLLKGCPFVVDVLDLWPEAVASSGMMSNRSAMWLLDKWCNGFYRSADHLVAVSQGYKRALADRGIPDSRVDVIYNWCDESQTRVSEKDTSLARELGMDGRFNILFAGNMGKVQALDAVIDAAKLVEAKSPNVQFVFIGDGVEVGNLKSKASSMGLSNVIFLPRRPVSEIGSIMQLADVLLVHLKDDPLLRITIPSKTQAYMAMGKPVLMCVNGDAADLVTSADAGLVCKPEDPALIADVACKLARMPAEQLSQMGANGLEYYRREMSISVGVRRFEAIFESVVEEHRTNHPQS